MEKQRGNLGLEIPLQTSKNANLEELSPQAIEKWQDSLPMADTGACAKKIYSMLRLINSTDLPYKDRFSILEILRKPIILICHALKKHYEFQKVCLTKEKQTIAALAQTIQNDLACGYKIIIEEIYNENKIDKHNNIAINCTIRVYQIYKLILNRCSKLYNIAPKNFWLEIYILYQLAEIKQWNHSKSDLKQDLTEDDIETIDQLFKQLMLMDITNPLQWRQKEQEAIFLAIPLWEKYVEIRNYKNSDPKKNSIFIFDYHVDSQPLPINIGKIKVKAKSTKILDINNLVAHLEPIINELNNNEIKSRLNHEHDPEYNIPTLTIKRLFKNWKKRADRSLPRFPLPGVMEITFGLSATHFYISGEKVFDSKGEDLEEPNTNSDSKNNEESLEFVAMDDIPLPDKMQKDNMDAPIYELNINDISQAGSCLVWNKNYYPPIQPGEIIGMRSLENKEDDIWSIGVIRWILHLPDNTIKIGTQLLAPFAKDVGAQIIKNNKPAGHFLRCLILPKIPSLKLNKTLLTPGIPFKEGRQVIIKNNDNKETNIADLIKEVEGTTSFRQFEFKSQKNIQIDNIAEKHHSALDNEISHHAPQEEDLIERLNNYVDDNTEFDSVWDDL